MRYAPKDRSDLGSSAGSAVIVTGPLKVSKLMVTNTFIFIKLVDALSYVVNWHVVDWYFTGRQHFPCKRYTARKFGLKYSRVYGVMIAFFKPLMTRITANEPDWPYK